MKFRGWFIATFLLLGLLAPAEVRAACTLGVCTCTGSGSDSADGDCLEAALVTATFGDTIKLQCGQTYANAAGFTLLAKGAGTGTSADTITITVTDDCLADLPAAGVRIDPAAHIDGMARLQGNGGPVVGLEANAGDVHHYTIGPGLEITNNAAAEQASLLALSADINDTTAGVGIIVDRVYVHPVEVTLDDLHASGYLAGLPEVPLMTTGEIGLSITGTKSTLVKNSFILGGGYRRTDMNVALNSYGFISCGGTGTTLENNHIQGTYSAMFTGGCSGAPKTAFSATILADPAPTISAEGVWPPTGEATLSSVTGITVGTYVAMRIYPHSDAEQDIIRDNAEFSVGRVTAINGSRITFTREAGALPTNAEGVTGTINGAHSSTDTTIAIDNVDYNGANQEFTVCCNSHKFIITGDATVYLTTTYVTLSGNAGTITIAPGLTGDISDNTVVTFDAQSNAESFQDFFRVPMSGAGSTAQWDGWNFEDFVVRKNRLVTLNDSLPVTTPIKGAWEVKLAKNGLVEYNTFYSTRGADVFFYPQNQNGDMPWSATVDVEFRYNVILTATRCVNTPNGVRYNVQDQTVSGDIRYTHNICVADSLTNTNRGDQRVIIGTNGNVNVLRHNTFAAVTGSRGVRFESPGHPIDWIIEDNILGGIGISGWGCGDTPPANFPDPEVCWEGFAVNRRNLMVDNRDPLGGYPAVYDGTDEAWPNLYGGHEVSYIGWRTPGLSYAAIDHGGGYAGGETTIHIDGVEPGRTLGTDGALIFAGDVRYTPTAPAVFNGGEADVSITPALAGAAADNEALVVYFDDSAMRSWDVRLLGSSPGAHAATDGLDIGANPRTIYAGMARNGGRLDWPFTWIPGSITIPPGGPVIIGAQ